MKVLFILFISLFAYAEDISIIGTWKLTNSERPFSCCSLAGYEVTLRFTTKGRVELLKKGAKVTDTTRHYNLKDDELNVYLESKSVGFFGNLFMKNSSSNKIFKIEQVSAKCFKAIQTKNKANNFVMCKIK